MRKKVLLIGIITIGIDIQKTRSLLKTLMDFHWIGYYKKRCFLMGKEKPKSYSKKVKIIILIICILVMPFLIQSIPFIVNQIKRDYEAHRHFEEVYEFVKKNEEIFLEFSEYQCSSSKDINTIINIEREGNMQDIRDIIFKYFDYGSAKIDIDGNVSATYYGHCYSSYEIILMLSENIGKERTENKEAKIINDDIYIFMLQTKW